VLEVHRTFRSCGPFGETLPIKGECCLPTISGRPDTNSRHTRPCDSWHWFQCSECQSGWCIWGLAFDWSHQPGE
jgi:hypothetical protein